MRRRVHQLVSLFGYGSEVLRENKTSWRGMPVNEFRVLPGHDPPVVWSTTVAGNVFAYRSCGRCATIQVQMAPHHISDDDLERYYLGMVTDESELAPLEERLLACPPCVKRAEEAQDRVDAIRAGTIEGGFDLE